MIVGVRGATASTLIATAMRPRAGDAEKFLMSEEARRRGVSMIALDEIVWGGWDVIDERWEETLHRHGVLAPDPDLVARLESVTAYPPIVFEVDHAAVVERVRPETGTAHVLARVRDQIRDFRRRHGVEQVVLLHLGAPAILPEPERWPADPDDLLLSMSRGELASAPVFYTVAAILEGCAIIDYTASATLEVEAIRELATGAGVPLAGRDGSTGQTLLKSVLAETFATRRLRVRGWYSTNILGNHDGFVLSDDRYAGVKRHDKTALLEPILGYEVESHLVDIRFYRPAGDEKEAWDAVDFETWHGGRGQLRIDWRASDSLLAAPALLDLVRFVVHAWRRGESGLLVHLGVFFKHALGTDERRYLRLARALWEHLDRKGTRALYSEGAGIDDPARCGRSTR
jgi:myo-inositol-1-phosphate synthase